MVRSEIRGSGCSVQNNREKNWLGPSGLKQSNFFNGLKIPISVMCCSIFSNYCLCCTKVLFAYYPYIKTV